eukprot:1748624-Alexandrium_andersonii.AAC.1
MLALSDLGVECVLGASHHQGIKRIDQVWASTSTRVTRREVFDPPRGDHPLLAVTLRAFLGRQVQEWRLPRHAKAELGGGGGTLGGTEDPD